MSVSVNAAPHVSSKKSGNVQKMCRAVEFFNKASMCVAQWERCSLFRSTRPQKRVGAGPLEAIDAVACVVLCEIINPESFQVDCLHARHDSPAGFLCWQQLHTGTVTCTPPRLRVQVRAAGRTKATSAGLAQFWTPHHHYGSHVQALGERELMHKR